MLTPSPRASGEFPAKPPRSEPRFESFSLGVRFRNCVWRYDSADATSATMRAARSLSTASPDTAHEKSFPSNVMTGPRAASSITIEHARKGAVAQRALERVAF